MPMAQQVSCGDDVQYADPDPNGADNVVPVPVPFPEQNLRSVTPFSPVLLIRFSVPGVERVLSSPGILDARCESDGSRLQRPTRDFGNVAGHPYLDGTRARSCGGDYDPGEKDIDLAQIAESDKGTWPADRL